METSQEYIEAVNAMRKIKNIDELAALEYLAGSLKEDLIEERKAQEKE